VAMATNSLRVDHRARVGESFTYASWDGVAGLSRVCPRGCSERARSRMGPRQH